MIIGRVNEYNAAIIPIQMRGSVRQIEVIIDTGFHGADLLLPRATITQLGLALAGDVIFRLANGQEAIFNYYNGEVLWDNGFKAVRILESERAYLASADLLAGSHVEIDMTPGGVVTISELPAS